MKHKVKVTVIDKKLYPELQQQYCADSDSGSCPCYNVGDEFVFYRNDERDDFWHMGLNTLTKTTSDPDTVAGGPKMPHCSEAWDAISRIHLHRAAGWLDYERLDERREYNDSLLLRWNKACNI